MSTGKIDVVFAVLPFAEVSRPSIGVSLLASQIRRQGFSVRIEYLNLRLAELIGISLYRRVVHEFLPSLLVGEWFFADAVFGATIPHESDYLSKQLSRYWAPGDTLIEDLLRARQLRESFLKECSSRILERSARVVGFTTTFHQTCACLAVAQRLKASENPPAIVFGGGNCQGEMGRQLVASFPSIDYVCAGEADLSFPELLITILRDPSRGTPPGVFKRGEASGSGARPPAVAMDSLPPPDYADYFEQVKSSSLSSNLQLGLPVETARGCWWGEKHRCTFCGLNGDMLAYRSKSARRAFEEVTFLARTYKLNRIEFTDNMMDLRYIATLFPMLEASGLELFYEVKSNLRYDQLAAVRAAGVRGIQPGIESLSDEVLRLMGKGTSAAQNIQLLRWCEELGVEVAWNILAGIPGESASEYDKMANMVPLLMHLPPPMTCVPVRLDRFSPFFQRPADFGLIRIRPAPAYFYVYPLGRRELAKLAYFFDFDYLDGRNPMSYIDSLQRAVRRWCNLRLGDRGLRPVLDATLNNGTIDISDTRDIAVAPRYELTGLAARIYLACDRAQTICSLARLLVSFADEPAILAELAALLESKLLLQVGQKYLSLAVFHNRTQRCRAESLHGNTTFQQASSSQPLLHLA